MSKQSKCERALEKIGKSERGPWDYTADDMRAMYAAAIKDAVGVCKKTEQRENEWADRLHNGEQAIAEGKAETARDLAAEIGKGVE